MPSFNKAIDAILDIVSSSTNSMIDSNDMKFLVREALTKMAAGPDGVSGTSDDVLSPEALKDILKLLDSETLLDDIVDIAWSSTQPHREEAKKMALSWVRKMCPCLS